DDVCERARGVEDAQGKRASDGEVVAEHRAERDDARAAADEEDRTAELLLPDEVAADRAAQLELVAGPQLLGEVRRDLAVVESLDGQHDVPVFRGGGDRVAPLRLV